MDHVNAVVAGACVALALAGVGCDSSSDKPIIVQPVGGTGGAGGTAGTGGIGGMTGGTAGTGGIGGMTGGTAGAAGAGAGAGGMIAQGDAVPCEIDMIVIQACQNCHGAVPSFGAPASLITLADFQRDYAVVSTKQLMGQTFKMYELARIRLNREMGTSPMPQGPPLAEDKKAALNMWLMNGAPGGTACAGPTGGTGG